MCFSCICLFVLYVLVFVLFSFSWCRGLAAVCDCGTLWTFLLTFFFKLISWNTFLSSPHLCFIKVFICELFVSRDDPLMS